MMNILVFDIETVPDIAAGRKFYGISNTVNDEDAYELMKLARREQTGHDFLALPWQKVVAISVVLRRTDQLRVWSLAEKESDEKEIIQRFFDGIERYTPTLVSWNGSGFDLPVLHYRAMIHKVLATRYWENGQEDNQFRYNNYLNRYHERHTDLMDVLSAYQARAITSLDLMASILGYPGKLGMDGSKVWPAYQEGKIGEIRDYCETDVLNTYLIYLRYELMRGQLTETALLEEENKLRDYLHEQNKPHFIEFLDAWSHANTHH